MAHWITFNDYDRPYRFYCCSDCGRCYCTLYDPDILQWDECRLCHAPIDKEETNEGGLVLCML